MDENPDPVVALRGKLLGVLKDHVVAMGVSQKAAALTLGLSQPEISMILVDNVSKFSTERLIRIVTKLGLGLSFSVGRTEGTQHFLSPTLPD